MANVEWTDDVVFKLIELYEHYPCLYDISSADYHNKLKKRRCEQQEMPTQQVINWFLYSRLVTSDKMLS